MAVQVLGKVAYFNKGAYNSQTNYEINDVVSYNGSSYVSLNDNNQGNLPTNTNYWSVVAEKGDKGDTGKPFVIEKTYSTIESMVADYDNMNVNDYVMIQGSIEEQENATLWTKREVEVSPYKWAYLADFSGASGITGATPNIHIGNVTEGNEPSVTRRSGSSNENPILDFVLKTGAKGDTGATGNGISSIEKTSTSGLVDTYTIAFTNGTSTTIEVTNGRGIVSIAKTSSVDYVDTYTITYNDGTTSTFEVANSEVTEEEFDDVVDELSYLYDDLPKVEGEGTNLTLNNTRKGKMSNVLRGNTSQKTSILPDGYTQVDYIESSGTQYIDTGYKPNPNSKIEADMQFTDTTAQSRIFGNQNTETNGLCITIYINGSSPQKFAYACQNNAGDWKATTLDADTNRHLFIMDIPNDKVQIDSTSATLTSTHTNSSNLSLYILAYRPNEAGTVSETKAKAKIYSFKIWDNTVLVRDLIPCINNNNEVGMYDIVNNVFYANSGTGVFTYGSVVGIPNPDYPQDVDVVSGSNTIIFESKNLAHITTTSQTRHGITFTVNNDKSVLTNNTATSTNNLPLGNAFLKANLTYTLSGCPANGGSGKYLLRVLDSNSKLIASDSGSGKTFSIEQDDVCSIEILYYYGWNFNNLLFKPMIEVGSQATTYEPNQNQNYLINLGTMELCKIGDYQDYIAKSTGKNLFDVSNPMYVGMPLQLDGVVSGTSQVSNVSQYIAVKENTEYTLSLTNDNNSRRISFYSKELTSEVTSEDVISTINYSGNITTFKTPIGCKYIRFSYYKASVDVQLEKNSSATSYEPFGKDKWYKHSEIGKVVLDGSENWLDRQAGFTNYLSLKLSFSGAMTHSGLCNNFVYNSSYDLVQEHFLVNKTWQEIVITILKSRLNTADATGFKTWLSTHNTMIYYVLATPTNTEITDQTLIAQLDNFEKALSYNTQTNISQENNDLPFIISASAFMSLKYLFGNLETRVAELEESEPSEL